MQTAQQFYTLLLHTAKGSAINAAKSVLRINQATRQVTPHQPIC
jgi:hypothetical protein